MPGIGTQETTGAIDMIAVSRDRSEEESRVGGDAVLFRATTVRRQTPDDLPPSRLHPVSGRQRQAVQLDVSSAMGESNHPLPSMGRVIVNSLRASPCARQPTDWGLGVRHRTRGRLPLLRSGELVPPCWRNGRLRSRGLYLPPSESPADGPPRCVAA